MKSKNKQEQVKQKKTPQEIQQQLENYYSEGQFNEDGSKKIIREVDVAMSQLYELDKEYQRYRELLNSDPKSVFSKGFKARCYFAIKNVKEWIGRTGNLAPSEILRQDIPWMFKLWDKEEALLDKEKFCAQETHP